jgi:DivIVA domain-containing protein
MPEDRDVIARRDFPVVRRGYDAAAVDAHLEALADRIEAVERRAAEAAAPPASAGRAASERVRAIVEAAERTAADIERAAREDADRIRAEAAREAEALRAEVAERLRGLLAQVGAMEEDLSGIRAPQGPAPAPPAPAASAAPAHPPVLSDAEGGGREADGEADGGTGGAADGDTAGERLVALDMALSGRSREETERDLVETFGPGDRTELLDEVWATGGG